MGQYGAVCRHVGYCAPTGRVKGATYCACIHVAWSLCAAAVTTAIKMVSVQQIIVVSGASQHNAVLGSCCEAEQY